MSKISRDPETGRFVSTKNAPTVKLTVGEKTEVTLKNPLESYSKKFDHSKSNKLKAGQTVVLKLTKDIGPTGSPLVSIKRPNSSRAFYTTEENLVGVL